MAVVKRCFLTSALVVNVTKAKQWKNLYLKFPPKILPLEISYGSRLLSDQSYRYPQRFSRLQNISEMETYAHAELMTTNVPEDDDDLFTTKTYLENCDSLSDVLLMVDNMNNNNQLWEEELILYFNRIVKLYSKELSLGKPQSQLLDSKIFQVLLTKTLLTVPYLPTTHLASIFVHLQTLQIPFQSNVSRVFTMGLLARISDFFPQVC